MKRLLTYLIVVLGLGLTFSINANAAFDIKANMCLWISDQT